MRTREQREFELEGMSVDELRIQHAQAKRRVGIAAPLSAEPSTVGRMIREILEWEFPGTNVAAAKPSREKCQVIG